jgi:hypothetical protein
MPGREASSASFGPSISDTMATRPSRARTRAFPPIMAALMSLALWLPTACTSPAAPSTAHPVAATERDFRIWIGARSVGAGTTTFDLHSLGPSTHEFKIARTNLPSGALPLGTDGLTVNEDSPQLSHVERLAIVDIGQSITLTATLAPGRYVIFCNFEGHYLGGMHVGLQVDAPPG